MNILLHCLFPSYYFIQVFAITADSIIIYCVLNALFTYFIKYIQHLLYMHYKTFINMLYTISIFIIFIFIYIIIIIFY